MIVLQVPDGEDCEGCMFLDDDYFRDNPHCKLFREPLNIERSYGEISKVSKCKSCPANQGEV